jgi:hypothetical protein
MVGDIKTLCSSALYSNISHSAVSGLTPAATIGRCLPAVKSTRAVSCGFPASSTARMCSLSLGEICINHRSESWKALRDYGGKPQPMQVLSG